MEGTDTNKFLAFRFVILRESPLIVYSSATLDHPLGYLSFAPEAFLDRPSLSLISPAWSMSSVAPRVAAECQRIRALAPQANIVVLASDGMEGHALSAAGVPTIIGNPTILTDETVFRPRGFDGQVGADAVYNARFAPWKRHHLCRKIDSLALIYDRFPGADDIEDQVRRVLPQARYLNHEAGGGRFRRLSRAEVAAYISTCRVGLCLSAVEGAMRACMEYLFCGLPVVTTPAEGGRMRYLLEPFAKVVEPDEDAVKAAVDHFVKARLNPLAVRKAVANIVAFERHEFTATVNSIEKRTFGRESSPITIAPLIGNALRYRQVSDIAKSLELARA